MSSFLEYITINYAWFLFAAIIILLAIIGYYADKTNFGQKEDLDKQNEKETENHLEELTNKTFNVEKNDALNEKNKVEKKVETSNEKNKVEKEEETSTEINKEVKNNSNEKVKIENKVENQDLKSADNIANIDSNDKKQSKEQQNNFEENYKKLDKELDELLPDKGIISGDVGDLLNDIDSLSLDKTQKINISDIPDLDDVDLPEIKKMKKIDDDVWKF